MASKTTTWIVATVLVATGATLLSADMSYAFDASLRNGIEAARGVDMPVDLLGSGGAVTTVINTLLFIVGFLSVIMLIFGGIRYIVSGGNSNAVSAAKNTILYAIVGLIIALFSYAIVNFVLDSLTGGAGGNGFSPTNL